MPCHVTLRFISICGGTGVTIVYMASTSMAAVQGKGGGDLLVLPPSHRPSARAIDGATGARAESRASCRTASTLFTFKFQIVMLFNKICTQSVIET
jgi:hypothetical protein